jgi:hypothetical protein
MLALDKLSRKADRPTALSPMGLLKIDVCDGTGGKTSIANTPLCGDAKSVFQNPRQNIVKINQLTYFQQSIQQLELQQHQVRKSRS